MEPEKAKKTPNHCQLACDSGKHPKPVTTKFGRYHDIVRSENPVFGGWKGVPKSPAGHKSGFQGFLEGGRGA